MSGNQMDLFLPVRSFNQDGLDAARTLLRKMRNGEKVDEEALAILKSEKLTNPVLDCQKEIIRQKHETCLELAQTFYDLLGDDFLEKHRQDTGFWTWLAFAHWDFLVNRRGRTTFIGAERRWVYSNAGRDRIYHMVATPVYIYQALMQDGSKAREMLLHHPPQIENEFMKVLVWNQGFLQNKAAVETAVRLYYDRLAPSRIRRGATTASRPGNVMEFMRILQQYSITYDFYDAKDADILWEMLPRQFNKFKRGRKAGVKKEKE